MKQENDFTNAKVGDKVTCLENGLGKIVSIKSGENYPIKAVFGGYVSSYTLNGQISNRIILPFLFKGHLNFDIKITPVLPDLPDLKTGDVIEVKEVYGKVSLRYFQEFQACEHEQNRYYILSTRHKEYDTADMHVLEHFVRKVG